MAEFGSMSQNTFSGSYLPNNNAGGYTSNNNTPNKQQGQQNPEKNKIYTITLAELYHQKFVIILLTPAKLN